MAARTPPTTTPFSDPALWTEMFLVRGELMRELKATARARVSRDGVTTGIVEASGNFLWETREATSGAVLASGSAIVWLNACHDAAVSLVTHAAARRMTTGSR